jgi:L-malate glycosyltransferase
MTRDPGARRLRIGIVAHAELGGSGTVATDLAAGLADRGHEVHMITPRRPFRLQRPTGVLVHQVTAESHAMWSAPPWGLALAGHITTICHNASLDVLHAHFAIPYAAATELATHMLGDEAPPWVLTLHGSDVETLSSDPGYAELLRHVLRRAARTTVPSEYLRSRLNERVPGAEAEVIPNFVDTSRFCPDPALAPPSSGPVLVHASSFRPIKRVDDVVKIFANVAARLPARLLLLGDGPERKPALARLAALGLDDRVTAPGAQVDVQRWMKQAHLALLPSERESFGLAALEALASGVPVVGSQVGGLPEIVVQGRVGYLAAVGRVDEMSEAALRLLTDDETWYRARDAGRRHAQSFSPERSFDAYERVYREAIVRPEPGTAIQETT